MEDRYLSIDEIGRYLGVKSKDTIYSYIKTRKMPAFKVGNLWKFKKADVDNWVAKGMGKTSRKKV